MGMVFLWLLFAIFSAIIASSKGRSAVNWFFIGLLFGPFGLVVGLMSPLNNKPQNNNTDTNSLDIQDLTDLSNLKDKGILTDEEFETRKNKILHKPKIKEPEKTYGIGIVIVATIVIVTLLNMAYK